MIDNLNVMRRLFFIGILFVFIQNVNAQNDTLTLKIPSSKKKDISYPLCIRGNITDCIDTLYKHDDTLFIVLQDTRKYYGDGKKIVYFVTDFEITGKTKLKIPIQNEFNCDFIILKVFDWVCSFNKDKKKDKVYKLSSIKEVEADYSNKKVKNINDKDCDVKIRH